MKSQIITIPTRKPNVLKVKEPNGCHNYELKNNKNNKKVHSMCIICSKVIGKSIL